MIEPWQPLPIELTAVYNDLTPSRQPQVWNKLRSISNNLHNAWIVDDDFNAMLFASEKSRGRRLRVNRINAFASCLVDCGLSDLGYCGNKFTWPNGRSTSSHISERLDRACGDLNWIRRFPNTIVRHLTNFTSNHKPILIDTRSNRRYFVR